jgi:hypothetical protein
MEMIRKLLIVSVLACCSLSASTYYVATNGNDSTGDGSNELPWRSITNGISHVNDGDTLYVRGGTYYERVWCGDDGTLTQPITLAGYPGETAILDGEFTRPTSAGSGLLQIQADYWIVSNLTVRCSSYYGIAYSTCSTNWLYNVNSYSNIQSGIVTLCPRTWIQDCTVWECSLTNAGFPGVTNSGGINIRDDANYCVITNCTAYHNWGESISVVGAKGVVVSHCTTYDSQTPFYWMSSDDGILENCMIYSTGGSYRNPSHPRLDTLLFGDELGRSGSSNVVVRNNLIRGCYHSVYAWSLYPTNGLINCMFAGNTFGPVDGDANVRFHCDTNYGNVFINNIVYDDSVTGSMLNDGFVCTNNLWYPAVGTNMAGSGDVLADPLLRQYGETGPGELTYEWFQLSIASPARDAGIANANLTADFLGTTRDDPPDIGGLQYEPYRILRAGTIRAGTLRGP